MEYVHGYLPRDQLYQRLHKGADIWVATTPPGERALDILIMYAFSLYMYHGKVVASNFMTARVVGEAAAST